MNSAQKEISNSLQFKDNPRKISGSQREQLSNHLAKFGDLGGVVYCRNNKAYVGGNQRSTIFDGSSITYIDSFTTPLPDKTVALGFIEWNGNKYLYREVEFTTEEFREACIAANNDGGDWDERVFQALWTKQELEEFGLNTSDFENLFPDQEELNLANGEFEPTTGIDYMKFGGYKIPLSDIELAGLNTKADSYFSLNGTLLGFVQSLLSC
jgi:hypothetical protein